MGVAYCCNCGIEIPETDKTRLCDRCKKILLPFVKFMDASTSSGVKRLISNEQNLRNAGVTDSGMDYLLKVCELHDKKKMQERREREAKQQTPTEQPIAEPVKVTESYTETELPMDEPLNLIRTPYGTLLPAAEVVLTIVGTALAAWFIYAIITKQGVEIPSLVGSIGAFFSAYAANAAKKILADLEEIKKRFR